MEEIRELKERLEGERPVEWDALPDIGLYMDQLISYMPRQLIRYGEGESLTSAMVNNYIKDGAMPRAEGKRYSRTHLAYLTALCALKQVLSIQEVAQLIRMQAQVCEMQRAYDYFCGQLEEALQQAAQGTPVAPEADDDRLVVIHATRAVASKVYLQKRLEFESRAE